MRSNMQFLPYNHSLRTEFHVPEISGTNRNNTSLYACCAKWLCERPHTRGFTIVNNSSRMNKQMEG